MGLFDLHVDSCELFLGFVRAVGRNFSIKRDEVCAGSPSTLNFAGMCYSWVLYAQPHRVWRSCCKRSSYGNKCLPILSYALYGSKIDRRWSWGPAQDSKLVALGIAVQAFALATLW